MDTVLLIGMAVAMVGVPVWLLPGEWKLVVVPPVGIIGYTVMVCWAVQNGAGNLPPFLWVWASIFAFWFLVAVDVVAVAVPIVKRIFK
jgi:hypothetical protein